MYKNEKIQPYPTTISLRPENQECPIYFIDSWLTPTNLFFVRNHFEYPPINECSFILPIKGDVKKPFVVTYRDLLKMPSKTIICPLECSGNKRKLFDEGIFGTQWGEGAISQAEWKGVPLYNLLKMADPKSTAKNVVFEGHDQGTIEGIEGIHHFARSLSVEQALDQDIIVAYQMNGKPIPVEHGYPLRLIAPKWYAMASVKWLKCIKVIDHDFDGYYQAIDYYYYPNRNNDRDRVPVTYMKVNSIIQYPLDFSTLDKGTYMIRGIAWTGKGTIDKVQISTNGGKTWSDAKIRRNQNMPLGWVAWWKEWKADKTGQYTIMARAYDTCGRAQPLKVEWNRLGYGYNGITNRKIKIV
ncbi:MAG: sulfite oxidase [Clostridia bacterium]|nr:sulfite oxidase [Clostridia bacterium]